MLTILAGAPPFRPHTMKAGPGSATTTQATGLPAVIPGQKMRVAENYGKLPSSFECNEGQTDGRVKFLSRGSGTFTLFDVPGAGMGALQGTSITPGLRFNPALPSGNARSEGTARLRTKT
jgi:hypothetical protein